MKLHELRPPAGRPEGEEGRARHRLGLGQDGAVVKRTGRLAARAVARGRIRGRTDAAAATAAQARFHQCTLRAGYVAVNVEELNRFDAESW